MDHKRERMCHPKMTYIKLEEELEYNIGRKEELKIDVRKLEKQIEDIRLVNWNNAKAQMETERELSDIKSKMEILEKENKELKAVNNKTNMEEMQSEIGKLQETINLLMDENTNTVSNLESENRNLRTQIHNLLICEECGIRFNSKLEMDTHIRSKHPFNRPKCNKCSKCFENEVLLSNHISSIHPAKEFKCDICDKSLKSEEDLNSHIKRQHPSKKEVSEVYKKFNELNSKLSKQKLKIYDDILIIKQREQMENSKCKCKGT